MSEEPEFTPEKEIFNRKGEDLESQTDSKISELEDLVGDDPDNQVYNIGVDISVISAEFRDVIRDVIREWITAESLRGEVEEKVKELETELEEWREDSVEREKLLNSVVLDNLNDEQRWEQILRVWKKIPQKFLDAWDDNPLILFEE